MLAGSLSRVAMQERELIKPTTSEEVLGCSTGSRPKFKPQIGTDNNQTALRCPRCDSNNTKFCYYNNYSLLQPRYFCKSCRRYWTKGGALRNVPVGGGCRKNKRISRQRTPSEIPPATNHMFSSPLDPICTPFFSFDAATSANLSPTNPSLSLMQPSGSPAANLVYFNLPTDGIKDGGNPPLQQFMMRPSSTDHQQNAGLFSRQLASYLPSALASQYLSNVGALPFHNVGFNPSSDNDYLAANSTGEQFINSSYIQANPHVPATGTDSNHKARFKAFNLALDHNHNTTDQHHHHNERIWAESPQEQKLLAAQKINRMAAIENQAMGGPRYTQLRPNLSPKVEEGWQGQAEASTAADQGANFWNNGGWNDIPGYNPGADHSLM